MSNNKLDRRHLLGAATLAAASAVVATSAEAQAPSSGRMTVHVLDLFSGTPASGGKVDLYSKTGEEMKLVKTVMTGGNGRPDSGALLQGDTFTAGRYVVSFDLADYFKSKDPTLPANFYRKVTMEIEVTDAKQPHRIPVQCTPWTQACSVLPG